MHGQVIKNEAQKSKISAISDPTTNDFGYQTKPTVVILGTVGHGKSNFLNRLAGENAFESKKQIESVTLVPKMFETEDFKLIDTPGLNDMRIDTKDWVDRHNDPAGATSP